MPEVTVGAYVLVPRECPPIGGKDDTHPIEWVRRVGGHDAVEGDL